ncbi:Lipoprotein NlpI precursor [Methylobrevis pamukkalensis]|uniref:Lipoprotein NlpI n=2 Tax=Methylobrevis pamukkalensis TaxID=1439726 RepID=A0A1E3GXW0_9HYPH|nr:Lipoprotein NlpI precursor [Methylobrevis pamukkalensis]
MTLDRRARAGTDRRTRRSAFRLAAVLALASAAFLPAGGALAGRTGDAVSFPPGESTAGNFLAGFHADRAKDFDAASLYFTRALLTDPEDTYLLERAFTLTLADGEIKGAFGLSRRLLAIDPDNRLANLASGVDLLERGSYTKAIDAFGKSHSEPLTELIAGILQAWAEYGAGRTDKALDRLDAMNGPQWFELFRSYHAGLIADASGRSDEAIERLRVAHGFDEGSIRITEAYVRALSRAGRFDEANAVVDELLARVPDHGVLNRLKTNLVAKTKMKPLATDARHGAAELLSGVANAISRDDGSELVAGLLQLALHLDPKTDIARITLAEIFERSKNYERAIEMLGLVDEKSGFKRAAEIQIGFDYNALDKVEEARKHLEGVIRANPKDLDALTALGNILRVRKMFEPAADAYTQAIEALGTPAPQHWQLYYNRGIAYERTKRWPQAEADFKTALKLSPDQPLVLNYLGYSWVDRGENFDEALGMIEKAVEAEPSDGYIVDSLGWVFYKLGRYEEAVAQLERAVELRPADPTINDHLGDAYWRVGRTIEARFQWAHARDTDPEPEELPKILKKLQEGLPPLTSKQASEGTKPSGG